MGTDSATLEAIRKTIADRGIEFIFAQFVDMYGRPSAKLVPAQLHARALAVEPGPVCV